MGFDLNGLNPIIKSEAPDIEKDYDAYRQWHDDNPGVYFRNNIWLWRPLWSFVCKECDDILTARDAEMGSFNDGHKISKTKATRIAKRLRKLLDNGEVDLHKAGYDAHVEIVNDEWAGNYPFSVGNVIDFIQFCEESGGFEIY